ncbi:MAG: SOS response-associated peptidase [Gemmatirosa sp.]
MCGRFGLIAPRLLAEGGLLDALRPDEVAPGVGVPGELAPRYNVAPSTEVLVALAHRREGWVRRRLTMARWGFVPAGAPDGRIGHRLANARCEGAARTPAFRDAWRRGQRCLIPADLFYEWQAIDAPPSAKGRGKPARRPWAFAMVDDAPFTLGGLWSSWRDPAAPDAPPLLSCAVLTTAPNALVAEVHDRMPVIVPREGYDAWLDRGTDPSATSTLLAPYPAESMRRWRVSPWVNDPRHDDPDVVAPVADGPSA